MRTFTRTENAVIMPAGEYWVGDPCYAVPEDRWMEWLNTADYTNQCAGARYLIAEVDGWPVLGIGTAYGDGVYEGSDGSQYPVDAGLIGVVPVQVADVDKPRHDMAEQSKGEAPFGMHRHTFTSDFECRFHEDGGVIELGHIAIMTDPPEDEPEYYDDPEGDEYYPQGEDR